MNEKECPQCIGTGEVLEVIKGKIITSSIKTSKKKKIFIPYKCKLCNGKGVVNEDVTIDYECNIINDFNE